MSHYIISSIVKPSLVSEKDKSQFIILSEALKAGSEFVIIEKEELSGNLEPHLEKAVRHLIDIEKVNLGCRTTGIADLSSSNLGEWREAHKKFISILFYNKTVFNARFISFFPATKIVPPICFAFEHLSQKNITPQVGPQGQNLGTLIKNGNLVDWFCAKHIRLIFESLNIHSSGTTAIILFFEQEARKIIFSGRMPLFGELKQMAEKNEKLKNAFEQYNVLSLFDHWIINGAKAQEKDAYAVVGQYLYNTKNPVWNDFHLSGINPELMIEKINAGEKIYRNSYYEDKSISNIIKKIVSAVACTYITGHFRTTDESVCFDSFDRTIGKISAYDFISRHNLPVLFATAKPPSKWSSENMRLNTVEDYTILSKNLDNGQYSGICLDLYNLILNLVDVEKGIAQLPSGSGKYIKEVVVDVINNAGVKQMSYRMYSIYSILYSLKQKGMDFGYLSYSLDGNHPDTSFSLKKMREFLDINMHPKELPASFYGIDENMEALHRRAIRDNTYRLLDRI
ncbi:MAG: hypothetical protein DRN66_00070 [Candidatus Nanohalarchaeota archaeon]|nr:MAG: hypothetical protein DRN66_00070 [Candidatus Nanohaloarchaeota archaeon]